MQEKRHCPDRVFSDTVLFIGSNMGNINLEGWVGAWGGGECTLLAGTKVLGMLHLREEEFQELDGHAHIRREKVLS